MLNHYTHRSAPVNDLATPASPFLQDIGYVVLHPSAPLIYRCTFDVNYYCDAWYRVLDIRLPEGIATSVPKRRAEFLAGRFAAKLALSDLGLANADILNSADRAPVWPGDTVGSITHTDNRAMGCVAPGGLFHGLGIDVEKVITQPLLSQIRSSIVSDNELRYLESLDCPLEWGFTLVFSAKESLFKCLYRQVGRYFDFLDAELSCVNPEKCTFTLRLLRPLGISLPEGTTVGGRYRFFNTEVLTQIAVPARSAFATQS